MSVHRGTLITLIALGGALAALFLPADARAQAYGPPRPGETAIALDHTTEPATPENAWDFTAPSAQINPASMMGEAGRVLSALGGGRPYAPAGSAAGPTGGSPGPVPQGPTNSDDQRGGFTVALNIMVLLTVVTLVPSIMLMTTCFMRILIVLSLLGRAIGTQSIPPAQAVTGLALIMTAVIMGPTIDRIHDEALVPWQNGELAGYDELWDRSAQPLRDYMFDQIEATGNWSGLYTMLNYRGVDTSRMDQLTRGDIDTATLTAAYMLSELKTGFIMGFRIYLPFLVIDMVIASILISMSMMMLPPVLISLPFKLLLFVLVDGWALVVGSLMESFVQDGMSARMSAQAACLLVFAMPIAFRPAAPPGPAALPDLTKGRRHGL